MEQTENKIEMYDGVEMNIDTVGKDINLSNVH